MALRRHLIAAATIALAQVQEWQEDTLARAQRGTPVALELGLVRPIRRCNRSGAVAVRVCCRKMGGKATNTRAALVEVRAGPRRCSGAQGKEAAMHAQPSEQLASRARRGSRRRHLCDAAGADGRVWLLV